MSALRLILQVYDKFPDRHSWVLKWTSSCQLIAMALYDFEMCNLIEKSRVKSFLWGVFDPQHKDKFKK